jgi:hypothetical protein
MVVPDSFGVSLGLSQPARAMDEPSAEHLLVLEITKTACHEIGLEQFGVGVQKEREIGALISEQVVKSLPMRANDILDDFETQVVG